MPANLRTTANLVDYEVAGSRMNGRVWELTLKATARRNRPLLLWGLQVTTEDGKDFRLPPGKVMENTPLTEGVPIKIEASMSTLPPGVKKLSKVVLVEHQTAFGRGAEPVVFLDVPIEPDPEVAGGPAVGKGTIAGGDPVAGRRVPANLRTTANLVDYEVASRGQRPGLGADLESHGPALPALLLWGLQVTTEDGKTFSLPPGKVMEQKPMTVGVPIKIEATMSTLPPGVTKLKQVVLVEHQSAFGPGAEPVVFLDVPIEPDPEVGGGLPRKK